MGGVRWLTVDLPETVEDRRRLLPEPPRQRTLACSALDERWMEEVDTSRGLMVKLADRISSLGVLWPVLPAGRRRWCVSWALATG